MQRILSAVTGPVLAVLTMGTAPGMELEGNFMQGGMALGRVLPGIGGSEEGAQGGQAPAGIGDQPPGADQGAQLGERRRARARRGVRGRHSSLGFDRDSTRRSAIGDAGAGRSARGAPQSAR